MLLAALSYAPALAIPGQTDAQLLAWGKGNSVLTDFQRVHSNDTGGPGYEYMATLKVDGHDIEFHAEPRDGAILLEAFMFLDLAPSPPPMQSVDVLRDVIASAYGAQHASDFTSARRLANTGNAGLWRGKLLGYASIGDAFLVFTPRYFDAWAAQTH